jgi:demethylmenaquinone methyltransferase/2-methoxy-6-polyprenyl-1,4-benzoquinol methylase
MHATLEAKRNFFDDLAERWDSFTDAPAVTRQLESVLTAAGIRPDEHVLDLGCGTGILTLWLRKFISGGSITAVDISRRMIEQARQKCGEEGISWLVADAAALPVPSGSFNRVLCFSTWPHFTDPGPVCKEIHRILKPGRELHIIHTIPREKVNAVHTGAGGPIAGDLLPPAADVGQLLERHGFTITGTIDNDERYFVTALKS